MKVHERIQSDRPCQISGTRDSLVISECDRHGKPLRNLINQESGLIFVDPVPFVDTEAFYHKDYRKAYKGIDEPKPKHIFRAGKVALERYVRMSKKISSDAVFLDAGSSSGEFVYLLNKLGFDAEGIEANESYAQFSRRALGVKVSVIPFSKFKSEKKFDVISMFHVLEHLENPVQDLCKLSECLDQNGRFFIEVPNILYQNMSFKNKWHGGHLFSFTEFSLPMLMQKAGFETVCCKPIGNGANLWGEFKKRSHLENSEETPDYNVSELILKPLKEAKIKYFLSIGNYTKFIGKLVRQIKELWFVRKMKNAKEILDSIYN